MSPIVYLPNVIQLKQTTQISGKQYKIKQDNKNLMTKFKKNKI